MREGGERKERKNRGCRGLREGGREVREEKQGPTIVNGQVIGLRELTDTVSHVITIKLFSY